MKNILKKFADEEFGNAVIDWTVLMAGAVMMAVAVVMTISSSATPIADSTADIISERPIGG